MSAEQRRAFRRAHAERDHRRQMQIGQGQLRAEQIRPRAVGILGRHQFLDRREAGFGTRDRGGDLRLVRGATFRRRIATFDIDVPDQRPVEIRIDQPADLRHPRTAARISGHERWPAERLIDIAHDRRRLIEPEPVMLEGRNAPERMQPRIPIRHRAEDVDLDQPVFDTLLHQRQPRRADIDGIGSAVEGGWRHEIKQLVMLGNAGRAAQFLLEYLLQCVALLERVPRQTYLETTPRRPQERTPRF